MFTAYFSRVNFDTFIHTFYDILTVFHTNYNTVI